MENNPDSTPDRFLCTKNILNNLKNIELTPDLGSDHLAIKFSLDLECSPMPYPIETKYNFSACKVKKINEKMCGVIKSETPITPDYIAWFTEQLSDTILAQTPVGYHNQKIPPYKD